MVSAGDGIYSQPVNHCDHLIIVFIIAVKVCLFSVYTTASLSVLESDIDTVHPLLLGAESASGPLISRLLEQVGVRRLTATDVIHHHILPTLRSDGWRVSAVHYRD